MFVNYRYFYFYSLLFLITIFHSNGLSCDDLTSDVDKDTPCFLESLTTNPLVLRTSGNSLVLPCHVARSKHANVEWWYSDPTKSVNLKIYPVYPPVRPTVLRFLTSSAPVSKHSNETDIVDASILLRHVNVDDSGTYRCVILNSEIVDPVEQIEYILSSENSNKASLNYQVKITAPRLCQSNPNALPCFTAMRTSSPTVVDAYQATFLQCVVKTFNRAANVFWVVGEESQNSILITDHLITNQYNGDQLKRVFPFSPYDHSLELIINNELPQRAYSCVIEGANEYETTIFTYIIRTINAEHNQTNVLQQTKIVAHDALNTKEIHSLRDEKQKQGANEEDQKEDKDSDESQQNETSTNI